MDSRTSHASGINTVVYFSFHVFELSFPLPPPSAAPWRSTLRTAAVLGNQRSRVLLLSRLPLCWILLGNRRLCPHRTLQALRYVTAFSCGVGPIPSLLLPEIFPLQVRAAGVAFSMAVNWVCNFFVGCFFLPATAMVGVGGVYLFFGLVCLMSTTFIYCCVTETKGLSLEEIGGF
ncbi:unnamed protein product [Closterium sp. NIES-53]